MIEDQLVSTIANVFIDAYSEQKNRDTAMLADLEDAFESDRARQRLATDYPALARSLEGETPEGREQLFEAYAIGVGVAHAILHALGQPR